MSKTAPHYDIAQVVNALRDVRIRSLIARQREHRPPRLPSRKDLAILMENLAAALYPNRLGPADLDEEGIDFFVGRTLNSCCHILVEQLSRELRFNAEQQPVSDGDIESTAREMARVFISRLPDIRLLLDSDIDAAYQGDPAALNVDEVLVCYPGITAILYHRIAHQLHLLGAPITARIIAEIAHSSTGIDIHPGAQIGGSFFIDHGTGVVIGETAIIGQRVRLYQAVTLGAKRFPADESGMLVKGNARHPIVEDDVVIYAGATLLGRITIGAGSIIGGNVWLTRSVPPGSHITQSQTRNENFEV